MITLTGIDDSVRQCESNAHLHKLVPCKGLISTNSVQVWCC